MKKLFLVLLSVTLVTQISVADKGDEMHAQHFQPFELVHAAFHGDYTEVRRLIATTSSLDSTVNINEINSMGFTALMWAVLNDDVEIAKVLVIAGTNPDVANIDGQTVWDMVKDKPFMAATIKQAIKNKHGVDIP